MTSEEKQEIINAVLAALRTNSKSIDQLTPVSEMSGNDFLELNGGRKVSYGVLFANHMSNDDAQEAWEYLDTHKVDKDSRGLVEVHQATVVYLDAMGNLDGHSLNGSEGLEYRTDTKLIYDFPGGLFGAPKAGAVYISKNNFKKFVWNGTDLEELKADECPLFVDYSEPVSFATLPVGGSYYVPSSHKIAVKIDASNTKAYDPLPDALYFFRDKGMIYTWKSSTNKWVPAGSDIKVVNNLTEGGEADALSAEQGKVLKGLIDNIGTGSIAAFAQYAVCESVSALPATGVATTGYIVGNHIYAYVGTGGDTADGAYQDLGALEAAGVSVTTAEDGTFTIHAGGKDYTVNLNHSHENMAKLVVCAESGLPSTLDMDTIYAQVDDAETPTEIQSLWIAGLKFVGGGGGVPDDEPKITSPRSGATIDFAGQSSVTLFVKGKNLTAALSLAVTGDFTVSLNGSTVSSISASDVNNGVSLTLTKGNAFSDGTIVISSTEVERTCSVEDSESTVIVPLTAIKLTGTQWLQTNFVPTPNTDVEMTLKFTETSRSWDTTEKGYYFLTCYTLQSSQKQYAAYLKEQSGSDAMIASIVTNSTVQLINLPRTSVVLDKSKFSYSHGGLMAFVAGENGTVYSVQGNPVSQQTDPITIGIYHSTSGTDTLFNKFILTIYELKITDSGTVVRDYKPARINGIPGLYDEGTGHFISSKTSYAVEEVISGS